MKIANDDWLVARDALLEHDPQRAAHIANDILSVTDHPPPSRAFKKALYDAPSSDRSAFEERVPGWEKKPGKPELEEKKPGVLAFYIPGHGYFDADVLVYNRYKRLPRKKLLAKVLQIYEGIGIGNRGDKAAHWKDYAKDYLAMIVANAHGDDDT